MRAEDILPGHTDTVDLHGVTVRKGTVGAFLANALALRDPATPLGQRAAALRDIEDALPALAALRLFDVFELRDPELRAFVGARL
ncbi:hypothetical protein IP92_02735 [Pseudoduganella flava]|uniref:Preprotein translocase subunit SecD n=1 Tax=Pseudoduganella flava TaxID=871742 RepID=A0A562PTB3_9BURK|nr:hypothetical protein [Pseudoduganella flava]QGZ39051.1 hypothetical protein GO485_08330 [Pseudoduganella flava]TWI47675.1 hypothetical protein IP92_02735 [Pseudoduganella flava]